MEQLVGPEARAGAVSAVRVELRSLFENIAGAERVVFDARDSAGYSLEGLHVLALADGGYAGIYHTRVGNEYELRLARSNDLQHWEFCRTLADNAGMSYVYRLDPPEPGAGQWIVLAHELWFEPCSTGPCRIIFKLFHSESDLIANNVADSWLAPGDFSLIMGTPNIYDNRFYFHEQRWQADLFIGFHYRDSSDRDCIGFGLLAGFGGTSEPEWSLCTADSYVKNITYEGASGALGARDSGVLLNTNITLQEGNIQGAPLQCHNPRAARLWFYCWPMSLEYGWPEVGWHPDPCQFEESPEFYFEAINPHTPGGSVAFGTPTFAVLNRPEGEGKCVFISYRIFAEGAAKGEAGTLTFVQSLPE